MKQKSFPSVRGFSLVELLAVMAIIAIIAAATIPAVTGVMSSSTITQAGSMVADKLKEAAEDSLAQHTVIEVRFLSYADASVPGGTAYQAMQLFKVSDDLTTYTQLGPVMQLPKPAIMLSGLPYSTLLQSGATSVTAPVAQNQPPIPSIGSNYTYLRFAYHPNGSTDLPVVNSDDGTTTTLYFLTVAAPKPSPPRDFVTISVDPMSGKVSIYRP